MIKKYTNGSVTWIDVYKPTTEDVRILMEDYNISPDTAHDLQLPAYKEKIISYKDYIYLSLHFPALRHTNTDKIDQEVDFVVGKDFIITARYDSIDALERFSKTFELDSILNKKVMISHAGLTFYSMLNELYKAMSDEVDSLDDTLEELDRNLFKGKERTMVNKISEVNRNLISFNHLMFNHKSVLLSLKNSDSKLLGKDFSENITRILNQYYKIESDLVNNIEFVKELRYTNDSLLTAKQSETMKHLTMMAFVTFPLTLMTSMFGMNTRYMPIIGHDYDFFIIVFIMFVIAIMFFAFFKFKKWL